MGFPSGAPAWRRYIWAALFTAAALALRTLLDPVLQHRQVFAFFYLSVALTAWFAGLGPALASILGGMLFGYVMLLEQEEGWTMVGIVSILTYLCVSFLFLALIHHARRVQEIAQNSKEQTQAVLARQSALLGALAESVLDAILIVSRDGKTLYANEQHGRLWKFPPALAAAGGEVAALAWAESQVEDPLEFRRGVALAYGPSAEQMRDVVRMKDGRVFERFGAPVVNKEVHHGWVWTFRDITEQKRVEAKVRESELHLRNVLNNLFAFVVELTVDGTVKEVNQAALFASRLQPGDVVGKRFWDCYWWAYAAEVQGQLRNAVERAASGDVVRFDVMARISDSEQVCLDLQIAPLRNSSGIITHLIPSALDVTARREAEHALRESEQLFYRAFSDAPIGMVLTDLNGRLQYVNRAYCELTGYSEEELFTPGTSLQRLTLPEDVPASAAAMRKLLTGETHAYFLEKRYVRKDGTHVWVRTSASVRRDIQGRAFQLIGLVENIDERRRAEEALRESEERFAALADNIPQLAWMTDADGVVLWLNRRWSDYTGVGLKEMEENGWASVHHPDHPERIAASWRHALETGEPWEETMPLRAKDGIFRWFLSRALPIRDKDGRVTRWFGTNTDITQERELLRREADTRHTLEIAMRVGRIGTFEWDVPKGMYVWSKETAAFFGYDEEELSGTPEMFLSRIHPGDRGLLRRELRNVFKDHASSCTFQFRTHRPDGSVAWLIVRGHPEFDPAGTPLRVIGVVVDVTAMKESELALAQARDQLMQHTANLERLVEERTARLTETVHELETFSYSLSHDLRAPLRAMRGFSQILQTQYAEVLPDPGRQLLRRITTAAGRLDQLIQDVLTYSRVVREQIVLQAIDVEKLLQQLMDENPALQPPNAQITIMRPLLRVVGHEAHLMQVLSNLVYNAVKFVEPGIQPRIRVWTEKREAEVRLCVQDNGIGIARADQLRLFEMFQRVHPDRDFEGTGIGLAIVRKAVERMNGLSGVDSEPGRGSTFWVQLRQP